MKLTINGIEVEVDRPVTILEAAAKVGVYIPTLCQHESLEPYGGCRMCLVEVERVPRLQTACTVKVTDGMVVKTETDTINEARRAMLEFLLINHPLDCPVCDKAGECTLQDLVARYGAHQSRFLEGKRRHPENFHDPFIVRNMERCIICTRCVRMCDNVQGAYAIAVTGRGSHSFVEPFTGGEYKCEYCGNCLTVCPVGAIMSRLHRHSYRPWYVEREVETVCGYCGVGCTMTLQMRGGSILRTIPQAGRGVNSGLLCVRGRFGYDFVDSDERLNTPLIRKDGNLEPVTWDEAIAYTTSKLKEIKARYGGQSIAAVASGRCTNEDNYMLQKFVRFVLGSNNIDSMSRVFYSPALEYLESIFGQGVTANLIAGIGKSDGALVLGGDPTAINPILGIQVRAIWKNGGKIIVIGPPAGLRMFVDSEIVPPVFCEEKVLHAIVAGLREKKALSGENTIIEKKIKALSVPNQSDIEKLGISDGLIQKTVQTLSIMKTPVVVIGPSLTIGNDPVRCLFLASAIAYLLNARVFLLSEKPNSQGAMDMGCEPGMLPGGRPVELEAIGHKLKGTLGLKAPDEKGLDLFEQIDAACEGKLKAMYVMGENLVANLPDRQRTLQGLKNLEFLVVSDIFMTETASMANVVFPAASWAEADGTFTNLERRLQRVRRAKPTSNGRSSWRVISDLAKNMGMKESYPDVRDVWGEITHVSALHMGIMYHDIETGKAIWPYKGDPLRGKEGEFHVESTDEPAMCSDGKIYLLPYKPLYHSGTVSSKSKALVSISPVALVYIDVELAERLGISNNDIVKLETTKGTLEVAVKTELSLPQNAVYVAGTFESASVMSLLSYRRDPVLGLMCLDDNIVEIKRIPK